MHEDEVKHFGRLTNNVNGLHEIFKDIREALRGPRGTFGGPQGDLGISEVPRQIYLSIQNLASRLGDLGT